jgi:ParB family chromosome partitioning protein
MADPQTQTAVLIPMDRITVVNPRVRNRKSFR